MIRIFFLLISALVLTGFAWLAWYFYETERFRKSVNKLMAQLDLKYTDFIEKRITLSYLEDKNLSEEFSNISMEAERVLKPELEAIYSTLNAASLISSSLNYRSPYFAGVVALVDAQGGKYNTKGKEIFSRASLYRSVKDAIDADLAKRELDYKVGNTL